MTVMEHKYLVMKQCFAVGLYYQGITHDLSKFCPEEFINGCRYFQGGKRSPNNREREVKGYSQAWMHHKGRNKHHFEFWNDYRVRTESGQWTIPASTSAYSENITGISMGAVSMAKVYRPP